MKKLFYSVIAVILGLFMVVGVACSDNDPPAETTYALNYTSLTLEVDATQQLTVTATPAKEDLTVTYESSNEDVATVSESGLVTALSAGSATVTAKVDGKTLTCSVTVTAKEDEKPEPIEYTYTLNPEAVTLEAGTTQQLTVTVTPVKEIEVTYTSSNEDVATVSESGLVTAVSAGSATITAEVDGEELTCAVTVTAKPEPEYTYTLSPTEVTLTVDGTQQLTVTDEEGKTVSAGITYETSNEGVATVSASGLVTAVGAGAANITVTVDGQEYICSVIVKTKVEVTYTLNYTEKTLKVGETLQLSVTASNGSTPAVAYESEDDTVADVTAAGRVTAKKVGETIITATVGTVTLTCEITVETNDAEIEYEFILSHASYELEEEDTHTLAIIVTPDDGTSFDVVWAASGAVEVNGNGLTATVTAVEPGEGTVTATIGDVQLTCTYTVAGKPIAYTYTLELEGEEFDYAHTDLELNETKNTAEFTLLSDPEGADLTGAAWSSDNSSVVTAVDGIVTAVGVGETDIHVRVGTETITVHVKVTLTLDVSATTKVAASDGSPVNLSDNDDTLDTLYWEHYDGYGEGNDRHKQIETASGKTDLIATNFDGKLGELNYGAANDFGFRLGWTDGTSTKVWPYNRDMLHTKSAADGNKAPLTHFELTVTVDENVKAIRLYTGAWRATNTVTVYAGGLLIATSESFTAGDTAEARAVTISLHTTEQTTITIRVTPSDMGADGNVSLPGVVVLGQSQVNKVAATTEITGHTKLEMTDYNTNHVNLTEKGTLDWYYLNYENVPDRMNTQTKYIVDDSVYAEGNQKFWDYKAAFNWTNGTLYPNSPIDNDCNNQGTNNGGCGAFVYADVKVSSAVKNVTLWVGGWKSTYYVMVLDSHGNKIYTTDAYHQEVDGQTFAYETTFAINAPVDDTLTFVVYHTSSFGGNASLAAIAVS